MLIKKQQSPSQKTMAESHGEEQTMAESCMRAD